VFILFVIKWIFLVLEKPWKWILKPLAKWILIPTVILLSVAIISCHVISVAQMTTKLAGYLSLSNSCEVIFCEQSLIISLSFSSISSLYSNHPSEAKEAACLSPGVTLFYNQVLLTCQGHTFTWSTPARHMHISSPYIWAITQSFLFHMYVISSFHSIHLRQAIKVCTQTPKIPATMSYFEKDDFPVNPPCLSSRNCLRCP
jgi:hypothetical protein